MFVRDLCTNRYSITIDVCHYRAILNLCMPYTSRDEIAAAVRSSIDEPIQNDNACVDHSHASSYFNMALIFDPVR